jgi:SP family general alpha glucoside:H+ symporter-like MFS transporter
VTGLGVERFGYRPFILGVLFYQCAVTTIFFVAPSIEILLVAECFAGIAFGVFMSGTHSPETLCGFLFRKR